MGAKFLLLLAMLFITVRKRRYTFHLSVVTFFNQAFCAVKTMNHVNIIIIIIIISMT